MALASVQFPLTIYGITPNSETDKYQECQVTMLTTAQQLIEQVIPSMFGQHVEPSEYGLFETEFVRERMGNADENDAQTVYQKGGKLHRKFISQTNLLPKDATYQQHHSHTFHF